MSEVIGRFFVGYFLTALGVFSALYLVSLTWLYQ